MPDSEPVPGSRAVFLSYANEDTDVALAVCEALREAGVEVWMDHNELQGGDAWDAKIRRQIRECALFIPIISAKTQARAEGYFRLEWRLADERVQLRAHGMVLILPVVADATKQSEALVPPSFLTVQWVRLPGGNVPPAFAMRVRRLLGLDSESSTPLAETGVEPAAFRTFAAQRARAARRWRSAAQFVAGALLSLSLAEVSGWLGAATSAP
ncbi:MAG: toll/interleukin-1 receptor domain-containing protein, partial [Gammaproteobacteria bacterium]